MELACCTGVMSTRAMLTCAGRLAAQTITSATSSGGQRLHALVDLGGALEVSTKAHQAEVRLHHARVHARHPDRRSQNILSQAIVDGALGGLGAAIDSAIGIAEFSGR